MQNKDIRTKGYILRRTNYGEADRILNIITPNGKVAAMAKGVRKERSKLAGGIELFTLTDLNIHIGSGELGIVTSAKMLRYYDEIVKDLGKMELAVNILKKISRLSENADSQEFFRIADQSLKAINGDDKLDLVEAWCNLNLVKTIGEEVNLYRDEKGKKLIAEKQYGWDAGRAVFCESASGEYGVNEIKMMRLMVSSDYSVVRRVKIPDNSIAMILRLARGVI